MRSNEAIAREIRSLERDVRRELVQKFQRAHPDTPEEGPTGYSDKFLKFVRYQFPELVKKDPDQKPRISLYIHEGLYEKINEYAPKTSMSTQISNMFQEFFSMYDAVLGELDKPRPGSDHAKNTSATVPKTIKDDFTEFVQKQICLSKSEATRFILLHMYLLSRMDTSNPPHYSPKGLTHII
jgi:hypothetical protein